MNLSSAVKKVSAVVIAGVFVVGASGCGQSDSTADKNADKVATSTASPSATSNDKNKAEDKDQETIDASSFGYDFDKASASDSVVKSYGEKATENAVVDVMDAMAKVKSNERMYDAKDEDSKEYQSLKPYMTKRGWERNKKIDDANDSNSNDSEVFIAMGFTCDSKGQIYALKKGAKSTSKDTNDYNLIDCDKKENANLSNAKISDVKVEPYTRKSDDDLLSNVPEHVVVSMNVEQKYHGTDDKDKKQWQVFNIDTKFYLMPNSDKKDHWLIDSAYFNYEYKDSSYSN